MRLGLVSEAKSPNAFYRAIGPLTAMEGRGHEVIWPASDEGTGDPRQLATCDVVHVYRRADDETRRMLSKLMRSGVPITYDNDDDSTAAPKQSPVYREVGGFKGQRIFLATVQVARWAGLFTTTSDVLAEKYRRAGVERIQVIGNYLMAESFGSRRRHDGIVVGWVAAGEHREDAARIEIADALRRLTAKHETVRVECIGVNLALPERYRHDGFVPFFELPARVSGFDVGIAPLADTTFNRARSDIKLKEYAAAGVPWLASPVGPYVGLGEQQGGRLVADDGWFEALDHLVTHDRERRRLARRAEKWAKSQTIAAIAARWEQNFTEVAASASTPS